ncbi:MAG: hypothetical protein AAFY10_03365 [Pseudomonadota bacterium]
MAYQIADDILDATGQESMTGKAVRKDAVMIFSLTCWRG